MHPSNKRGARFRVWLRAFQIDEILRRQESLASENHNNNNDKTRDKPARRPAARNKK